MGVVTAQALPLDRRGMSGIHLNRLLDVGMTGKTYILDSPLELNTGFTNRYVMAYRAISLEHGGMGVFALHVFKIRGVRVMAIDAVHFIDIEIFVPLHLDDLLFIVTVQAKEIPLLNEQVLEGRRVSGMAGLTIFLGKWFMLISLIEFPGKF